MKLAYLMAIFFVVGILLLLTACTGPQGEVGTTGPQGPTGNIGVTGPQGTPGVDAEPVTIVQLCPGNSSYGTFIEIAFCVAGQLYGTYSANGGFSTLIAPGTYNSNGINSTCTFTVTEGCTVQ